MERDHINEELIPENPWTEDGWVPVQYAKVNREKIIGQMDKKKREEQKKLEMELKKKEEERKQEEKKKEQEKELKEAAQQQKKQKKAQKKKENKKEESLAPTYSKSELKRAEVLKREKQSMQDRQKNEEQKEQEEKEEPDESTEEIPESESPNMGTKRSWRGLLVLMVISFVVIAFVLIVRLFPTYRLVLDVPYKSYDAFEQLTKSLKSVYGSRLVVSQMNDQVNEKVKQMFIQINFKTFGELCDFYISPWFKRLVHFYMMEYRVY